MGKVELLAPGGSIAGIRAAAAAGADAVYAGGSLFGARAYAENPEGDDMLSAIDFCHLHGVKFYLTVNTLLKDRELSRKLYDYILPLYEQGIDAVLVQDLGVFRCLKEHFPDLPIHASTQMTIAGAPGAVLLQKMGAERVVLSRELSLREIQEIRRKTDVELETFVHGALCYCYSGQCLMSSMIGGRSGNRGRCAQPCRLPWQLTDERTGLTGKEDPRYLLSLKDICTLQILPDLIDAGISSLKVEGRMKRPEYAAGVTRIYRKYIDLYRSEGREGYRVDPDDMTALSDLFCRGGFSEGYYRMKSGPSMMASLRPDHSGTLAAIVRETGKKTIFSAAEDLYTGDSLIIGGREYRMKEDVKAGETFPADGVSGVRKGEKIMRVRAQHLLDTLSEQYVKKQPSVPADAEVFLSPGKPLKVIVSSGAQKAAAEGSPLQQAEKRPLTEDTVRKQTGKTGDTLFEFQNISVDIDGSCFCQVSEMNRVRREALSALEEKLLSGFRRKAPDGKTGRLADGKTGRLADRKTGRLADGCRAGRISDSGGSEAGSHADFVPHPAVTASVMNGDQLRAVLGEERIGGVYLDTSMFVYPSSPEPEDLIFRVHEAGKKAYLAMPYVWRLDVQTVFSHCLPEEKIRQFDGLLLRSIDQFGSLGDYRLPAGMEVIADAGVYTWNREAAAEVFRLGATSETIPYECTAKELSGRDLRSSELVVYGRIPLMVTAQCLRKNSASCTHTPSFMTLTDRKKIRFPVRTECAFCGNIIFNSVPLELVTAKEEQKLLNPGSVRYFFTTESGEETAEILSGHLPEKVTRGHIRKGVE